MRYLVIARQGYGNPRRGIEYAAPGSIITVPDVLGAHLIASGILAPAPAPEPKAKPETTAVAPPENAAKRTGKPTPKASKSSPPAKEKAE